MGSKKKSPKGSPRLKISWAQDKRGFFVCRKKFHADTAPQIYFIPHCELDKFELKEDDDFPKSNIAEAKEILRAAPPAASHVVALHGEFTKSLTREGCPGIQTVFQAPCCAVDLDKLKEVLGIVE